MAYCFNCIKKWQQQYGKRHNIHLLRYSLSQTSQDWFHYLYWLFYKNGAFSKILKLEQIFFSFFTLKHFIRLNPVSVWSPAASMRHWLDFVAQAEHMKVARGLWRELLIMILV